MVSFWEQLRRRNVFRVGLAYLAISWLLIQVADVILPNIGAPTWIIQALIVSSALGFPLALILAWFYEVTPEGVRVTADDETAKGEKFTGRKIDLAIIGLLVLAVGFLIVENYVLEESTAPSLTADADRSIAVLPFVNTSSEPEQEYFSDGVTEELLNLLAKTPGFRVISRTSSFALKGENVDIPTVAERLDVSHVLEGSVRRSDDRVRITVQLIDAPSDTQLWSEIYDRTLDDIFAVQEEIAARVLGELQVVLLGDVPSLDTTDPEAYALYLQARHILNQGAVDGFPLADQALNQALAIDPDYVPALLELGWLYWSQATRQLRSRADARRLFRDLVARALEADPENGRVHATLAWLADDRAEAALHAERALELDPSNTDSLQILTPLIRELGHPEEALFLAEYTASRDPTCIQCLRRLAEAYQSAMRLDEAEAAIRTAQSLSPGRDPEHRILGWILLLKGEPAAALAEFEQDTDEEDRTLGATFALYDLGRQDEFAAHFAAVQEMQPREVGNVYAYIGEVDLAFEHLNRRVDNGSSLAEIPYDPFLSNLHDDPRWPALLERAGNSPAQLEALDFQVSLPR